MNAIETMKNILRVKWNPTRDTAAAFIIALRTTHATPPPHFIKSCKY